MGGLYACVSHVGFHRGEYFANVNTVRGKILQSYLGLISVTLGAIRSWSSLYLLVRSKVLIIS